MILPDQEVCTNHTKPTHAVDILAFVEAQEIPSAYFETPYYLTPAPGGEKLYTLLRETLRNTGKIGIAYVVIQSRQHLAALVPEGQSLVLQTLRWASESRYQRGDAEAVEPSGHDLALPLSFIDSAPEKWTIGRSENESGNLRTDEASAADSMMAFGRGTEIEVEELDGWLDEDEADDSDMLSLLFPTNPHAGRPRHASRQPTPKQRQAIYAARTRPRRISR